MARWQYVRPICTGEMFLLLLLCLMSVHFSEQALEPKDVAACLAIKIANMADMVDFNEWITYHAALGIGKIYFMDNNSSFPVIDHVWNHMKNGSLSYEYIPAVSNETDYNYHIDIYSLCLEHYGKLHKFMVFIDMDEFIIIPNKNSTSNDTSSPSSLSFFF